MATVYTGQLHPKRKQELFEIADSLGIGFSDVQSVNKTELEDSIRSHLSNNAKARTNPTYAGLWSSMGNKRKPRTPGGTTATEDDDADDEDQDSLGLEAHTPAFVKDVGTSIVKLGNHVVAAATPSPRRGGASGKQLVRRIPSVKSLAQSKSVQNLRAAAKEAERVVSTTQENLSHGWALSAIAADAEFFWIVWNAVPWQKKTFGPHKWLTRSDTPSFTVPLPSIDVLFHPTFYWPAFRWGIYTAVVPLIIALIFSFPRQAGPRRRSASTRIAPPNAVVFNVARLAVGVLVHYIFASKTGGRKWSFESVDGFPEIQLLGAGVAAVLAAYEELAKA